MVGPNNPESAPIEEPVLPERFSALDTSQEFIFFPKLPVELRDMIWKFPLPEPRIVEISGSRSRPINLSVPVILQVNQEARRLAKKHYSLELKNLRKQGQVYVDFNVDTLLIKDRKSMAKFYDVEAHWERPRPWELRSADVMKTLEDEVQHLALGGSSCLCAVNIEVYCHFTNLKTLSVDWEELYAGVSCVRRLAGYAWKEEFELILESRMQEY